MNTGIVNGTDREPIPLPINYISKYCGHLHTSENSTDVIWILRYNNQDDNFIENCSSTVIKSSQYFIASGQFCMKQRFKAGSLGLLGILVFSAIPRISEGRDIEYGKYLSSECSTCHGSKKSTDSGIPSINGKSANYLVKALQQYRSKTRKNSVMQMIAGRLDDEQISSLAAYFSSLRSLK